jgi:hypothetical protein
VQALTRGNVAVARSHSESMRVGIGGNRGGLRAILDRGEPFKRESQMSPRHDPIHQLEPANLLEPLDFSAVDPHTAGSSVHSRGRARSEPEPPHRLAAFAPAPASEPPSRVRASRGLRNATLIIAGALLCAGAGAALSHFGAFNVGKRQDPAKPMAGSPPAVPAPSKSELVEAAASEPATTGAGAGAAAAAPDVPGAPPTAAATPSAPPPRWTNPAPPAKPAPPSTTPPSAAPADAQRQDTRTAARSEERGQARESRRRDAERAGREERRFGDRALHEDDGIEERMIGRAPRDSGRVIGRGLREDEGVDERGRALREGGRGIRRGWREEPPGRAFRGEGPPLVLPFVGDGWFTRLGD